MEMIFRKAVSLGRYFGRLHFWTKTRHSFVEQALKARSEALFVGRVGRHHIKDQKDGYALRQRGKKLQNSLNKAAEKYEAYANLLADRHLDSIASIEFVQRMAGTLKNVFGKRLNSTVATIASVALDRAITPANVKDWCRGPFVKRSPKTRSPPGKKRLKSPRFSS
jgi:G:T/U-mismatch repair DNA glycosylase